MDIHVQARIVFVGKLVEYHEKNAGWIGIIQEHIK